MAQEVIISLFAIYGLVVVVFGILMGYIFAKMIIARDMEKIIRSERKNAVSFSRAVIKGKISEQILPLLPFFKYNLGDARFLGSPVDYIVFNGYSESNNFIEEIVFVEVKTGKSELSLTELAVKECIDSRRVRYEVITVDY